MVFNMHSQSIQESSQHIEQQPDLLWTNMINTSKGTTWFTQETSTHENYQTWTTRGT